MFSRIILLEENIFNARPRPPSREQGIEGGRKFKERGKEIVLGNGGNGQMVLTEFPFDRESMSVTKPTTLPDQPASLQRRPLSQLWVVIVAKGGSYCPVEDEEEEEKLREKRARRRGYSAPATFVIITRLPPPRPTLGCPAAQGGPQ